MSLKRCLSESNCSPDTLRAPELIPLPRQIRGGSNAGGTGPFTCTPIGSFDSGVRTIRITPAGRMNAASSGTSQANFTIRFRAQVQ